MARNIKLHFFLDGGSIKNPHTNAAGVLAIELARWTVDMMVQGASGPRWQRWPGPAAKSQLFTDSVLKKVVH